MNVLHSRVLAMVLIVTSSAAVCWGQTPPPAQQPVPGQTPAAGQQQYTIPQLLALAEAQRQAERYDEAIEILKVVIQRDEYNLDALRAMGDVYWDQQDVEQARVSWLAARQVQQNDFGANFGLGRLYLVSSVPRQAMHYLRTAEKVAPSDRMSETLLLLAQAYNGSGMREEALTTIQRALQIDPDDYDATAVLVRIRAEAASSEAELDRALIDADRLVQLAGDMMRDEGSSRESVERLYQAYGMELSVLYACREILFQRNPDGTLSDALMAGKQQRAAEVINRTVDVMLRRSDLSRTLTHFQIIELAVKAVEYTEGQDVESLMTLASLQVSTGRIGPAIESLESVLELQPENQAVQQQLQRLRAQYVPPANEDIVPNAVP